MKRKALTHLVRTAIVFWLFQKGELQKGASPAQDDAEQEERAGRIRCPQCKWEPNASTLWYCYECPYPEYFFGGCGAAWNTFDTGGLCPGCGHQWRWTACLRCGQWSPHQDWYGGEGEGDGDGDRGHSGPKS